MSVSWRELEEDAAPPLRRNLPMMVLGAPQLHRPNRGRRVPSKLEREPWVRPPTSHGALSHSPLSAFDVFSLLFRRSLCLAGLLICRSSLLALHALVLLCSHACSCCYEKATPARCSSSRPSPPRSGRDRPAVSVTWGPTEGWTVPAVPVPWHIGNLVSLASGTPAHASLRLSLPAPVLSSLCTCLSVLQLLDAKETAIRAKRC